MRKLNVALRRNLTLRRKSANTEPGNHMNAQSKSQPFANVAIVVVAAGRGLRAGGVIPKQYQPLGGRPLLAATIEALVAAAPGATIVPVVAADDHDLYLAAVRLLSPNATAAMANPATGGETRQASVKAGLRALADALPDTEIVLIHDGARPFVDGTLVAAAVAAARAHGAAVPGVPLADTIKQINEAGVVVATPARKSLRAAQTPQSFQFRLIHDAHTRAAAAGVKDLTDDAAVAEWAGAPVHIFPGDPGNMKITEPADFARAEARVIADLPDIRTGQGFDVHAFGPGDHVWFGGVRVPHDQGLEGHSDADVLAHAITDALLGAIADGDIGSHFPPSDPRWKGASSDIFLRHAADLVRARGGLIAHVDGTVICEAPKVGPHRDAIRARLAEILDLDMDRVAVKATTSERLGFAGRREGIAAMASATVRLPLKSH